MIQVIQKKTPHFVRGPWKGGRPARPVSAVVIHIAEGSERSVDSWFAADESKVSAHFLVGLDGELRQYVSIHDVAWHAGTVVRPRWAGLRGDSANGYTVGVEHEGNGRTRWPEAMLLTSATLTAWLCRRFGLIPSALTLPLHREIRADKTCPGPAFDRENYIERVNAILQIHGTAVPGLIRGIR